MPSPDAVYDVLVREAGEREHYRQTFRMYAASKRAVWHLPRRIYYLFDKNRVEGAGLAADNTKARTNAALAALEGGDD